MSPGFFLTGTDTEVGKTHAACALLRAFAAGGRRVLAMKPVAAGTDAQGRNDDVERLIAASNAAAPRPLINPYCFAPAIAPHLAAAAAGVAIDPARIVAAYRELASHAEIVIVEGAGGFLVPLDEQRTLADLAVMLSLPVILVVGLRLGCLNHALLTAEAIRQRGLPLAGWIGNRIDPAMSHVSDNLHTLARHLAAPCLGVLPWSTDPAATANALNLDLLAAGDGQPRPSFA